MIAPSNTRFFDLTPPLLVTVANYAVECTQSQCTDCAGQERALYVALHAIAKSQHNQRTWEAFVLAGRCKPAFSPWFVLGNGSMESWNVFATTSRDRIQSPDKPDAQCTHAKPFPLTFSGCLDVDVMELPITTCSEMVFIFLDALDRLSNEKLSTLDEQRDIVVSRLMNNLLILGEKAGFSMGLDIASICREVKMILIYHVFFLSKSKRKYENKRQQLEHYTDTKISCYKYYEELRQNLELYYQIKLFIELLNRYTQLARTILSKTAKNDFLSLIKECADVETRAFIHWWCRYQEGHVTTILRKKHWKEFKAKYFQHKNPKIRDMARVCLELSNVKYLREMNREVVEGLKSAHAALNKMSDLLKGYIPLFLQLFELIFPKSGEPWTFSDQLPLISPMEPIIESSFQALHTIEFLYALKYRSALFYYHGILNQVAVRGHKTFKPAPETEIIYSQLSLKNPQLLIPRATEISTKKRAVKQGLVNRTTAEGTEMPTPAMFRASLLPYLEPDFLEIEREFWIRKVV